ncbi:MAG TPA: stage II sporulation protein M, partial [Thioalkalivibrio sp.]|nr:stage II sporulation protein M [Thioalkalivibrio sp.]
MNQEQFIERHQASWQQLETLLERKRTRDAGEADEAGEIGDRGEFPRLY